MPEKVNYCTKDGQCFAQNFQEQKSCAYFTPLKTCYKGNCAYLYNNCDCLHPEALVAKLKERNEAEHIPIA